MNARRGWVLLAILAVAFIVRVYFIPAPGYERDVQLFKIWSRAGAEYGVGNLYDHEWCDYPPAYLYVFKTIGSVYRNFYPDYKEHTYLFDLLIKLPPIVMDLATALLLYFFIRRKYPERIARFACAAYAFNPFIIFNSAIWGQADSVPAFFALLSALLLSLEMPVFAWIAITIAFLIKTQFVIFVPLVFIYTVWKWGWKKNVCGMAAAFAAFLVIVLPFLLSHKVDQVVERLLQSVGEYPYLSMNAYNFWWLVSWGKGRRSSTARLFWGSLPIVWSGWLFLPVFTRWCSPIS